jgi:hypothetical protein
MNCCKPLIPKGSHRWRFSEVKKITKVEYPIINIQLMEKKPMKKGEYSMFKLHIHCILNIKPREKYQIGQWYTKPFRFEESVRKTTDLSACVAPDSVNQLKGVADL